MKTKLTIEQLLGKAFDSGYLCFGHRGGVHDKRSESARWQRDATLSIGHF